MTTLTERYAKKIRGTISCYDRVVIQGTLPGFCYAEGMTSFLYSQNIRVFDYAKFAEPLRDVIRDNAESIAVKNHLQIEYIQKKNFRKEDRIHDIIKKRGSHPGLVHIFSALEPCTSYKPWHDKNTHKTFLKYDSGKCLHYYFYFIDPVLGLAYVRVPTWCPFRLQIYFNGHGWLASQLNRKNVAFKLLDNAFAEISDFKKAQTIADSFNAECIHKILDSFANLYCPVIKQFRLSYHWSIMQAEYATDIVFNSQSELKTIYDNISRTAIHAVKAENVATFLSKKLHGNYQDEVGNRFNTRIQGTRIKHSMGPVSIKMYDKYSLILRVETTVNDVSFFKHYREVEQKDGTTSMQWAQMKKGIYSLASLQRLLLAANMRYIAFISELDDNTTGTDRLNKISKTVIEDEHTYKGFNLFDDDDQNLFEIIASGEFNISGFQNKTLRRKMPVYSGNQMSRILKRLRIHGLIRKIARTYKYYLTPLGKHVVVTGLKLKNMFIIPALGQHLPASV